MNKNQNQIFFIIMTLLMFPMLLFAQTPTITQQPQNQTVLEGETATFTLTAQGADPLSYQWYKNSILISGANSNTYITPSTTLGDDGAVFYCVVSDSNGSTNSDNATLTVIAGEAPAVTQQPSDQSVLIGEVVTFSVTATGTATLQYQWKKNDVDIAGATSNSYTIPSAIIEDDQAIFKCVITNNYGVDTSAEATLYVIDPSTRITNGLQLLYNFNEGEGNIISDVSGTGTAEDITIMTPEKIAWTPNGLETFKNAIARRETKSSKIISAVQASNEITIEAWVKAEFSPQPSARIFTFSVSGNYRNFSLIQNGSSYEVRIRTSNTDDNGLPSFQTSSGKATDELVHIVYTKDAAGVAKIYLNGTLDTSMTNAGDLVNWSSNQILAIASEPYGGVFWRGVYYLASVYDRALSEAEVLQNYNIGADFDYVPYFTIHPKDQFILEGESIFLDSYAVSVLPISYQWYKNGVAMPGETNRQLNLSNLGLLDNGAVFYCIATTSSGSTTSNSATVYITGLNERVSDGIQVFYTFREASGNKVSDVSGVGTPVDLTIFSADAVEWVDNGLKLNSESSILTTAPAQKVVDAAKLSNAITLEAWVMPSNLTQTGPASIFNLSQDANNRDFSLSQTTDSYNIRLRTTTTDNNGEPSVSSSAGSVSTSSFDHVAYTRDNQGNVKIFINGTERIATTVDGDFSNWGNHFLSIGNDVGGGAPWLGTINLLAVYNRALSNSEILRNYNFGAYGVVESPSNLIVTANEIKSVSISWDDNSTNEDGFIVERGEGNPVVFAVLASLPADSTYYTDLSVVDNRNYTYRVKAFNSIGESGYSNEVSVHTLISPLPAPSNLQYTLLSDGNPELTWNDNSDTELGFKIERRFTTAGAQFSLIDSVATDINTYVDRSVTDSTSYVYRVYAFNADTISEPTGQIIVDVLVSVNEENAIPTEYGLAQNYPNPFNPTTTIKFSLPQVSNVNISIFNLLGQKVYEIVDGNFAAGYHNIEFNASELTSGIYIYSIVASGNSGDNFKTSKKMILLK